MTNVIVNAIDVLGHDIDEGVVRLSAAEAQYAGGSLLLPEYHEQELVAGSTTIHGVTPGQVVVSIHWGINRTATFRVYVPTATEITLAELALQRYDTDPAVVSQVADAAVRAEGAAARAETTVGSAEAVLEARDEAVAAATYLGDAQAVLTARDDTVAAVTVLGNAQTVLAARDQATAAASAAAASESTIVQGVEAVQGFVEDLPATVGAELDVRVPPAVASAIAADRAVADAAAAGVAGALLNLKVTTYGGYKGTSVPLNDLLAGGRDSNTSVYYNVGGGSDRPSGLNGLLQVTNIGPQFVQIFYPASSNSVWQRRLTDRTHINPGEWNITDWTRVDQDQRVDEINNRLGTTLPQGVDFDTLTAARTWTIPTSGWSWPNQPAEGPGVLKVSDTGNSTGNMQVQEMTTINPVRVLHRFRNSSGNWQPWIQAGIHDVNHIDPGAGRRETVIQAGLKRRGGVIGTGGKAAIALRFDHHLQQFGDKVLPLLKNYRLPWGQMINPNNIGKGNDTWPWTQLATECHLAGGEVWNHSRSHSEVTHPVHADREISRSLEDLRENVPSVWVDSWAPPGQSNYLGYEGQDTPEKHWDTYPGRLILAQHAFVRGYYPGIYQPLAGPNLIGSPHTTIDSQTSAGVQALIRGARDAGAGLTLMLHSNYLDQDGYMTSSELDQVLAYIAQLRDNGEIVVLSNAGILMADASVPVRQTNMLTDAGAGVIETEWSQEVSSRSWKNHAGVTHEAEAWVSGTGQVSLEVDVASPSYPVTAEHTVTLSEGIPQRLSALVTPPMDTTGITVTLTGSVTHTGIIYRPI